MMKQPGLISFHFVPFPCAIWDDNIDLTMSEFRLLGYLLRLAYRFGKSTHIRLSDDELMHGRKDPDGHRKDKGCGLKNRASLRAARDALIAKGWIECEKNATDPARVKRFYSILLSPDEDTPHVENEAHEEEFEDEKSPMNSGVTESITHPTESIRQGDRFYTPDLQNLSPDQTIEGIHKRVFIRKTPSPSAYASGGDENPSRQPPSPPGPNKYYLSKKGKRLVGATLEEFTAFIQAFDYRKGVAEAADAWLGINWQDGTGRTHVELFQDILSAARAEAARRPDILRQGKTPKYPQGWINGRRWEDQSGNNENHHGRTFDDIEAAIQADLGASDGNKNGNRESDGAIEATFREILERDADLGHHHPDERLLQRTR
jgi:hypothetical protein